MKTLYIECKMGAAGDMLMSALSELTDASEFADKMNSLGIDGVEIKLDEIVRSGITGTKAHVLIDGIEEGEDCSHNHHHHTGLADVESIINSLTLPAKVKTDALQVYNSIAEAESKVHGSKVADIHFHEVGTIDAIADVVGTCLLMDMISPDRVVVSPVNVGGGTVRCAHGILPVPAPATALLLKDIPAYTDDKIMTELCTPTGAALIRHFSDVFAPMPAMKTSKVGYGFGAKTFEEAGRLNCLRAFLGEELSCDDSTLITQGTDDSTDRVCELCCNLDDMTGEDIGYAIDKLLEAGALDVFTTPIYMKKNRPGVLLSVLCPEDKRSRFIEAIFKHTTTIGVRETLHNRYILDRTKVSKDTKYGTIRYKEAQGYGVKKSKPEYDDLSNIADREDKPISEIREDIC